MTHNELRQLILQRGLTPRLTWANGQAELQLLRPDGTVAAYFFGKDESAVLGEGLRYAWAPSVSAVLSGILTMDRPKGIEGLPSEAQPTSVPEPPVDPGDQNDSPEPPADDAKRPEPPVQPTKKPSGGRKDSPKDTPPPPPPTD